MDSAHVVHYRLHQIKGHTENQRGRGREETGKQRGDRDEYQRERQKRTNNGEEQTDINTERQIYKKCARMKERRQFFEEEDINTVVIMCKAKN